MLAVLLGLNNAFENPARQSFMLEMVGAEHLRNAVSLNSVLVNVARAIGPAVAGHPDRHRRRRRLLPRQRGAASSRSSPRCRRWTRRRCNPTPAAGARQGQLREGLRYVAPHARARGPAADDGGGRLPRLRVPGLAAGDGEHGPARGRDRLRLHDRGDGRRRGRRRPARRRARAHGPAPARRVAAAAFGVAIALAALAPSLARRAGRARARRAARASRSCRPATRPSSWRAEPTMRGRVMALWFVAFQGSTPIGGPIVGALMAAAGAARRARRRGDHLPRRRGPRMARHRPAPLTAARGRRPRSRAPSPPS